MKKNNVKADTNKLLSDTKNIIDKGTEQAAITGKNVLNKTNKVASAAKVKTSDYIETHEIKDKVDVAVNVGTEYIKETASSASEATTGMYHGFKYSEADLNTLKESIENQGGFYRELNKNKDTIMVGGESLVSLLSIGIIPESVINAYEAAYPNLSQTISFADKVQELDGVGLTGFISGVKGKLFEQKYVEYLNSGNFPEGYTAVLAGAANQPGWDIAIEGGNGEIASVLQAKATDSVSYVKDAIEKYPNIDVVTTDEVYSHLVMSGISDNITNGNITNDSLIDILGCSVAAITNTWWLGVLGTVGSSMLGDRGKQKQELFEKLKYIEETNQLVINQLKG